jgi:tetratricopeptide (TPR) repeat protein
LGLVVLYLVVLPIRRRMAEETDRLHQAIRARQTAAASQNLPYDTTTLLVEAGGNSRNVTVQMRLAQNYFVSGQLAEAAQHARTLVQFYPQNREAWALLGDIERQANHFDAAMQAYREVLARDPNNPQALAGMGFLYVDVGWPLEARALLEPAVRAQPQDPLLKLPLALAYMQRGDFAKAEPLLQDAHRLAPDNVPLWSALLRLYNDTGRYQETLPLAEEALAKSSSGQQTLILYDKGVAQYKLNAIPEATATLSQALVQRPDNIYARFYFALCLQRSNQFEDAARELHTVLRQSPGYQQARQVLAQLDIRLHRTAEAQLLLAEHRRREVLAQKRNRIVETVATEPNSAQAHWQMALLCAQDKNVQRLVVELRKTLELDPHNREAQRLLQKTLGNASKPS